MRGEHGARRLLECPALGPSPRARGAQEQEVGHPVVGGTIPACAGSTSWPTTAAAPAEDHPRVRGEHEVKATGSIYRVGPSPRARGARNGPLAQAVLHGTIPACAGSTAQNPRRFGPRWDHPRVRGEHGSGHSETCFSPGPSPRARGARWSGADGAADQGTIPACAGSTPPRLRWPGATRDHPRVRGEHDVADFVGEIQRGPSPHARGAQSTTCKLTSDKQPNFQLLEKQTPDP